MQEDFALEARNKAGEYFKSGYNCSESIVLAFRDLVAPEMPVEVVRMATGLGGGLGHAGCMCGALTASAMVLGWKKGRTSTEEDRFAAYDLTRNFHDRFIEFFGNTCCRSLNPHPFDTKEHLKNCIKITGNTGKMLAQYMQEKGLV